MNVKLYENANNDAEIITGDNTGSQNCEIEVNNLMKFSLTGNSFPFFFDQVFSLFL